MQDVMSLFNLIFGAIVGIISIVGGLFGGYRFWDGWTNDQPADKKQGISIIIITAVVVVFLYQAKPIIMSMAGLV